MSKKLWEASNIIKNNSNLFKYEKFLSKKFNYIPSKNFNKLLKWSIKNSKNFWSSIWEFCKVKGEKNHKFKISKNLIKNQYLLNSKLNFAENLLSLNNDNKAITFISENKYREVRSWRELNTNTHNVINFFKKIKIKKNNRIAAYLPNYIETVESFLATAALGAIW